MKPSYVGLRLPPKESSVFKLNPLVKLKREELRARTKTKHNKKKEKGM
jgi:hypothetical protein